MIRVPFTDGQRMMVMPANLDELFRTECKHIIKQMEKAMVLAIIDHNWKEHLREMDDLKTQVQHAAYEQKDPLLVFKFEAFELFRGFTRALNDEVVSFLSKVEVPTPSEEELRQAQQAQQEARRRQEEQMRQLQAQQEARRQAEARAQEEAAQRAAQEQVALPETKEKKQPVRSSKTYGRNDKVTVRYVDGTVKRDVKFKTVEDDVSALRCFVVEE
jgi:preprotein translocase subunit SecA